MDYKYDIFISYRHEKKVHKPWALDFVEKLKVFLVEELISTPRIFIDEEGIRTGDRWRRALEEALGYSKILIPIWSVSYFVESEWCNKECAIMYYREMMLNEERRGRAPEGGAGAEPCRLLMPVRFMDGENYPPFAKDIQQFDCEIYNRAKRLSVGETKRFRAHMFHVKQWAPQVKERLMSAPPWDERWPTREWTEAALKHWDENADKFKPKPDPSPVRLTM
ncbi:MAG TPA: toll/interleukin-1 receptor domain-containing protein [Pyrinomonadaceae bacterium]|jgi:hypothetical protein